VLQAIASLRAAEISDLRGLAAALYARDIPTARSGEWHVSNVRNLIARDGQPNQ
jgi:hypothetical protein